MDDYGRRLSSATNRTGRKLDFVCQEMAKTKDHDKQIQFSLVVSLLG